MLANLYWTYCVLPILLVTLAEILLYQCLLWFQKVHIFFGPTSLKIILIEYLISSYMLFSCFNSWEFCFFLSNCFFIASFVFSIDVFTISQFLCSFLSKVSSFDNFIFIRSLFYRYLPKLSSNSIYLVVECFLLLYWNSTADNHSI